MPSRGLRPCYHGIDVDVENWRRRWTDREPRQGKWDHQENRAVCYEKEF